MVACGLAAWCRAQGLDVGVMKPVATGGRRIGGRYVSEDALRLVRAAGVNDPWPLVNPVCFKEPLAPLAAAERAGARISLTRIEQAFRALAHRHEFVIVEGGGGLLVPLTATATVADLAKRLGLPLLIVARPGLGTLNHALLTLRTARAAGLTACGLIINHHEPPPSDRMARLAIRTNPDILKRLCGVPIAGRLPYLRGSLNPKCLNRWINRHLNSRWLRCQLITS